MEIEVPIDVIVGFQEKNLFDCQLGKMVMHAINTGCKCSISLGSDKKLDAGTKCE